MITIRFHPRRKPQSLEPRAYWIAGRSVIADVRLRQLDPFEVWRPIPTFGMLPEVVFDRPDREEQELTVDSWIGSRLQTVTCRRSTDGYLLIIAEVGHFYVDVTGRDILVQHSGTEIEPPTLEVIEFALGPAIALALALQEVWCLQCSVVEAAGAAVVFLGSDGSGKSTIAKELYKNRVADKLVADNILPIEIKDRQLDCLPHFPQLELGVGQQFGQGNRDRMPVQKMCVLDVRDAGDNNPVSARTLSSLHAMEALVKHTIGADLFGPGLVERHRAFCSRVAERTEVVNVRYPLRWDSIARVGEMLQDFSGT